MCVEPNEKFRLICCMSGFLSFNFFGNSLLLYFTKVSMCNRLKTKKKKILFLLHRWFEKHCSIESLFYDIFNVKKKIRMSYLRVSKEPSGYQGKNV